MLNRLASWMAFAVRKTPMGASTKADTNLPMKAVVVPLLARRSPVMSTTQYSTKKSMEMTAGAPIPPFLRRAPMGAPMKNSSIQASAWANFFQISVSVR